MSFASAIKPKKVEILLDKPRTLFFTLNSFIELEDMYGSFAATMKLMEEGSMKAIRAILWAGLIHEDPSLTPESVGGMIDFRALGEITAKLHEAILDAVPKNEEDLKQLGDPEPEVNPQ